MNKRQKKKFKKKGEMKKYIKLSTLSFSFNNEPLLITIRHDRIIKTSRFINGRWKQVKLNIPNEDRHNIITTSHMIYKIKRIRCEQLKYSFSNIPLGEVTREVIDIVKGQ